MGRGYVPYPLSGKEILMKLKYLLYPLLVLTILGSITWWIWDRVIWGKTKEQ